MFFTSSIWLIFFRSLLHRKVLKFLLNQTFCWECMRKPTKNGKILTKKIII